MTTYGAPSDDKAGTMTLDFQNCAELQCGKNSDCGTVYVDTTPGKCFLYLVGWVWASLGVDVLTLTDVYFNWTRIEIISYHLLVNYYVAIWTVPFPTLPYFTISYLMLFYLILSSTGMDSQWQHKRMAYSCWLCWWMVNRCVCFRYSKMINWIHEEPWKT